jgi:hypothetical protein
MVGKKHNKFPDGSVMVSDQTGLKFHGHKVIPAQLQTKDNRKVKNTRVAAPSGFGLSYTDKKKIKFSSYIRKFRREQLQSHIQMTNGLLNVLIYG